MHNQPFSPQPLVTVEEIAALLASRRRAIAPDKWPPADCGDKWTVRVVSDWLGADSWEILAEVEKTRPQDRFRRVRRGGLV